MTNLWRKQMDFQGLISRIPLSFWRFALVGIGGLFVDLAVLYAGLWGLGLSWFSAKVISFFAAATFTWWMNRQYTFGKSNKSLLVEWASFLATNAFGGFVNLSVYTVVVTQFHPYVWLPAVATAMGSLGGLFFNYLSSKHLVFNQVSKLEILAMDSRVGEIPPFPRILFLVTCLVCLTFGATALWLGMDASWSLRNYHWYNGWAYVNSLTGRDGLVSQLASFFNPMVDVPFALAAERLPARAVGFLLGMLHGLNFLPLSAIAWQLSTLANTRHRLIASATLAMVGLCGAGGLSEVGLVSYDNVLSLGVLTSILLVVANWDKIVHESNIKGVAWTAMAGIPVGLVFGLKQPLAIYGVGLTAAFLIANMTLPRRILAAFCFGFGVLVGFALTGGYWAVHLWKAFGNPFFPNFNQIFQSPWALPIPNYDTSFIPQGLVAKILFIFRFSFDSRLCSETVFRDFRLLSLITLVLLAALARVWRKQAHPFTHPGPTVWMLAAGLAAFAIWVPLFSIYRYLIPLEMLAPLLSVAAIGLLPWGKRTRLGAAISLLALLTVSTVPADWIRVPWEDKAIAVNVPDVPQPSESLVLLSGHEPLSFLIPAFPKSMRFYRIDSTFTLPDESEAKFRSVFREAIRINRGPIYSLHSAKEGHEAIRKLAEYSLEFDKTSCREFSSPIGTGAYALCLTRKLSTAQ